MIYKKLAEEWLKENWDGKAPVDIEKILLSKGYSIHNIKHALGSIEPSTKNIFIKENIKENQKRFIIAHMYGHVLLQHFQKEFLKEGYSEVEENFLVNSNKKIEQYANSFAMELLLPKSIFFDFYQNHSEEETIQTFKVPKSVIAVRPKELNEDNLED
jgi:Zn-dependent peptidase ImmA (M78 family)